MKRLGVGILAVVWAVLSALPVYALGTTPSVDVSVKTNSLLLITGYSFSGHSLRYAQVFNSSSSVMSLDGWRVAVDWSGTQQVYATLSGLVAPNDYFTVANVSVVATGTFTFADVLPASEPTLVSLSLLPPDSVSVNNEVVSPTLTSSTPRVAGLPPTYYFTRNISSSTGNYLSTFTAFVPTATFSLVSDSLYVPPLATELQIVEVYPDSTACPPFVSANMCSDYVKLYNPSTSNLDLSRFRLRTGSLGQSATASNTATLNGTLAPNHYASFPISLSSSGSWVWLEDSYGLVKYEASLVQYPSSSNNENQAWSLNDQSMEWKWTIYPSPTDQPNRFAVPVTVNMCSGVRINEIAANVATEDQFVELYNPTDKVIELNGCVLQTNRSALKSFVFANESLEAGRYRTVYIKDTELTLTKTTSGTAYILSSDLSSEADAVSYDGLAENTAYANINDIWLSTYEITPNTTNVFLEFLPCDVGYFRNIETSLCNKMQAIGVDASDCGAGKYRSVETNRCRNLTTTSTPSAPCGINQERNSETNRCRSTLTTSQLTPCSANQERNPLTNRCRNKTANAVRDFSSQGVDKVQSGATLGWVAFACVAIIAAAYGIWEWRQEAISFIKRLGRFVARRF